MLHKIVYASCGAAGLEREELGRILSVSRARNAADGISGLLLYSEASFLQVLEGEEAVVRATYARILADRRHSDVRLLVDGPTVDRRFGAWSMGFEHLDEQRLAEVLPGYRSASRHPLASAAVIVDGDVAERVLDSHLGGPSVR